MIERYLNLLVRLGSFFLQPIAIADYICKQYGVEKIGIIDGVVEELYAITTQRRITHLAVVVINAVAMENIFLL